MTDLRTLYSSGGREGFFNSPSVCVNASIKCAYTDSAVTEFINISEGEPAPSKFVKPIASSVVSLFSFGCPFTVFGLVISFVVYSLKRMLWGRSTAHITKKSLKVISPQWANSYSLSTVPSVIGVIGICAASMAHTGPNIVFRCVAFSVFTRSFSGNVLA